MTIITVNTPEGRLSLDQRRVLAETLTDAVLVPEVGHFEPAARPGFQVRAEVIARLLAALTEACGLAEPSPAWWVNFRVIDEGSWASGGGVTSILSLLATGVFTEEKAKAIRAAIAG
ncbi:hypothetical protein [Streptomyces acidiscabies]|uniref:Tautomerase enzyme n=1 Tax=Streptomyces acidiscabies TaxID=42234 RepID=A0A0L0JL68_9ACTN|nr:hypothetical protein [Streptomyces acidiscabies]KND26149.1 hypothetical protein IQ63_38635 [Streptomyces acidiscabies]